MAVTRVLRSMRCNASGYLNFLLLSVQGELEGGTLCQELFKVDRVHLTKTGVKLLCVIVECALRGEGGRVTFEQGPLNTFGPCPMVRED